MQRAVEDGDGDEPDDDDHPESATLIIALAIHQNVSFNM